MKGLRAFINKKTLRLLRTNANASFEFLSNKLGKSIDIIKQWENEESDSYPTVNQAKAIADLYQVPFAALYMPPELIPVNKLPKMTNMRRIAIAEAMDDSSLNIAIIKVLGIRDKLLEDLRELDEEEIPAFDFTAPSSVDPAAWAEAIRQHFDISLDAQFKTGSARQLYLYLKQKIENKGIFVQCFHGVNVECARGFAIHYDALPVIGINENDRSPAKAFSLIHELVHIIKRASVLCTDMYTSLTTDKEEVFCNAVAGALLVPREALHSVMDDYNAPYNLKDIEKVAGKFSVSKEVILRRLYDVRPKYITKDEYVSFTRLLSYKLEMQKEEDKLARQEGRGPIIPRCPNQEAVDRNSFHLGKVIFLQFADGLLTSNDVSKTLGISPKYVGRYIKEVSRWV